MKDTLCKIWKWINHNRYTFASWAAVLLCLGVVGCGAWFQPKAPSPIDGKLISKIELDAVVTVFNAKAQAAYKMIELQETAINNIITAASTALNSVQSPFTPILTAVLGMAVPLLGRNADNKRKDQVIKQLKREPREPG